MLRTYLVYNTVVRLCQFFCRGRKVDFVRILYSHDRFSKIWRTFFVKKMIPYKPTYKKTISFLLCMDLQPYSHDCFAKNTNNFVWFPKHYLLGFFIFDKFQTGVPCFSITLFYSTLLALTHGQNYRQRNEYTRFAWAGGTFFPVVLLCCVSFWFWREMRELALHYFLADCFGIEWEIVFGVTYILSLQYSCAVVSFFCCGGKVNFVQMPYSHNRFSKILRTFFVKNYPI